MDETMVGGSGSFLLLEGRRSETTMSVSRARDTYEVMWWQSGQASERGRRLAATLVFVHSIVHWDEAVTVQ